MSVFDNFFFTEEATLKTGRGGAYVDGVWTPNDTPDEVPLTVIAQPVRDERRQDADGQRREADLRFFTPVSPAITVLRDGATGGRADVIEYRAERYVVLRKRVWLGGAYADSAYAEVLAVREDGQ